MAKSKPSEKKADPKISAKKAAFAALVVGAVDFIINYISTAQIDFLDLSVRAVVIGGLAGAANYLKHKFK